MSKIKSCFQILELKKYFGLVSTFMIFSLIIFSCENLDFKEKFNSKTTFEIKDFRNEDWSSIQKRKDTCNENLTATDTSVRLNNTIFNIKLTKKCLLDHNVIDSSRVYELNGGGKYVILYNNYEITINLKGEEFV